MPKPNPSFYEVLSAAVADLSEHGFDSIERVDRWVRELKAAAERDMMTPESMDQQLRNALAAIYQRLVEKGEIARYHPGIERYTIERIRPKLRAELDRRIMASANLIKLNRAQAIDKTLQRFQGWSTSIPPGGVSAETKAETKKTVRKALASLPFEERRVLIDQGHKLVSAINEIVAADGGAIAGVWRSHWREAGYNYREDHKERDEQVYLVRDSWAQRAGLVKKGDAGYFDQIDSPGTAPFCRCYMTWLYHLRDLPSDMLTAKGKASLSEARAMLRANAPGRADAATSTNFVDVGQGDMDAFTEAQALDVLGYLNGLGLVRATPDLDEWNAYYDSDADEVALRAKFSLKDRDDKVRTLLHEAGHRGQDVDRETYEAFKAAHLNRLPLFLSIANQTHLRDYERTGEVDSVAAEAFAESYARTMLGMPMPPELEEFWRARMDRGALTGQVEAEYIAYWPNKITRCQRCTMFARVNAGVADNRCTAVAGAISAHGHCRLFEIGQPAAPARPAIGAEALRVRLERIRTELEAAQ